MGGGARSLRVAGSHDRHDDLRELEEPRERDLGGAGAARRRDLGENVVAPERADPSRPPERRVRQQSDAGLNAAIDEPAPERAVVERGERDLDRGERCELERLVELLAGDVRHADIADETLVEQAAERADGRRPGCARIRYVHQVEVDRTPVERLEARLAVRPQCLCAPVRHPATAVAAHAALRDDPDPIRRPGLPEHASDEPLVVTELRLVAPVRACRVEHRDPCREGRRDRPLRSLGVALPVGRETHAAEPDPRLVGIEPRRHGGQVATNASATSVGRTIQTPTARTMAIAAKFRERSLGAAPQFPMSSQTA